VFVVAPADGLICLIDSAAPPPELELGDAELPRVSIFLSLLDAHVQRAPVSGEVIAVQHRPGRFGSADLAAASDDNERISMRIRTDGGVEIVAVQIAGLLARRIVLRRTRRGQAVDWRHLRPDPVRVTAGHLPARRHGGVGQRRSTCGCRRDGAGRAAVMTKPRGRRVVNLRILPSSMSVLAICAGLTSIRFALEGQPHVALALIAAAAILDGLDGRVARILDAESRMGEEIDSLADAVNFGVAPAVVIYVSMLSSSSAGWVVVLLYAGVNRVAISQV